MSKPVKFPVVRKESTYMIRATHDLHGVTAHPDGDAGVHDHHWHITLIWISEFNCKLGFIRDEYDVDQTFGKRIHELDQKNLSELMTLPATAENVALWLLYYWLPVLDNNDKGKYKASYELTGIRVTKGPHSSEIMRSAPNRRGWEWFGGEVS